MARQITHYDVAIHIRNKTLIEMGSFINYTWDNDYKIGCINEFIDNIKANKSYFPIDCNRLTMEQVRKLGFVIWNRHKDKELWCIPLYLFPFLKKGVKYTDINFKTIILDKDTDNDHRSGVVAFGVLL